RNGGRIRMVDWSAAQPLVYRNLRRPRMPAAAFDLDRNTVGSRHHRTGSQRELAYWKPGIVVHAIDFLDAEALHQTVLHHRLAPGAALLRRLEDDYRGAREVARLGEVMCSAEQHGCMTVMTAGMHLPRHR